MTTRKLDEIVTDIKTNQELVSRDLSPFPTAARAGLIMAANQAKTALKKLKAEYADTLLAKSIGFFVTGTIEQQKAFAELAAKLGKSITVDGDVMYQAYAVFLSPTVGHHKEFTINQLTKLEGLLQETSVTLDLERAKYPEIKGNNMVSDFAALVAYIKELTVASNGYNIAVPYIRNLISNKAIETNFNNKVLTVVTLNTNQLDQANYSKLFTKTVTIDLNKVESIDEDFVNKTLRDAFKVNKTQ